MLFVHFSRKRGSSSPNGCRAGVRLEVRPGCRHTGRCPDGDSGRLCLCTADDEGSLAEAVVAVLVLAIASAMLITFAMTSMRSERRLRLKNDAMHVLEVHSVVARRIDCVQQAGTSALQDTKACGPAPGSALTSGKLVEVDAGTATGESGHDLVSLEWQDYYHLENCGDTTEDNYPRAVREITVKWRDANDERSITRLVLGPVVPHSRGWVYKSKASGSAQRTQWDYTLVSGATTVTTPEWSTTYEYTQVKSSGSPTTTVTVPKQYCRVLVGRPGELKNGSIICKLKQGDNDVPTASDTPPARVASATDTCDNGSSF